MDPKADPIEPLLTVAEAAGILKCSLKTIRRRIDGGDLAVVRDGKLIRVRPEDLRRYITSRRHG